MAINVALAPLPTASLRFQVSQNLRTKKHTVFIKSKVGEKRPSISRRAAQSEEEKDDPSTAESSVRAQLDLLEQLTSSTNIGEGYESDDDTMRRTIREQLIELTRGRDGDFALQLGKKMKQSLKNLNILTVSQRRNIKRQAYLNEVAGRNDVVFFSTIGAFVILPPVVILAVAIQIGYVQLFP